MTPTTSLVRVVALALALTLPGGALRVASAQTLGGQLVQLDTRKPLGGAAVALVNDSAEVVTTGPLPLGYERHGGISRQPRATIARQSV